MNKDKIIGLAVIVALVFGVYGAFKNPTKKFVYENNGEPQLGAQAGPDLQSPSSCFSFEGQTRCYFSKKLSLAGTSGNGTYIPCSFKITATSTLVRATYQQTNSTSTAITVGFYRNILSTATTSAGAMWGTSVIAANSVGSTTIVMASTTNSVSDVLTPGQFFNITLTGLAGNNGYYPNASCNAEFLVL